MPKKNVRVTVPRDPTAAIELLGKIKTKSDELGDASPLKGLKWQEISPSLAIAKENDDNAETFKKKTENCYGTRDAEMPLVTQALRDSRDILLGINSANPKALTDWFYEVDDSPQSGGGSATDSGATTK
jgi:hypothetical protein